MTEVEDTRPEPAGGGPDLLDVAVLGPVLVRGAAGLVPVHGALSRALVVALVLRGGRPASVAALTEDLWPDEAPGSPRAALQNVVSRARRQAPGIRSVPGGYAWEGTSDLDVAHRALAPSGVPSGTTVVGRTAALRDALALWRGDPGADLLVAGPADDLRVRAESVRARLERSLLGALVAGGDDDAVPVGRAALAAAPTDEGVAADLMRALLAAGRAADALRVFAVLRDTVADGCGVGPGAEVRAVHEQCLRADDAARTVPSSGPAAPPSRGPVPAAREDGAAAPRGEEHRGRAIGLREAPNALVGRDGDLVRVEELARSARVVTVLGPGGLGKTRFAQEVAHRAARDAPLVVVVELASVRTDDDVGLAIATTLGVRDVSSTTRLGDRVGGADVRARVLERLAAPGTLLVLDNCEQVLGGASDWATAVVDGTAATVLTTSRAPLGLAAEVVHPLPSLSSTAVPGAGTDDAPGTAGPAVRLFAARAQAARPGVDLPVEAVRRLCDRLDGLPLAIELAAARVRSLSVVEIERRIASSSALLASTDRSAPERHRTLRAVIAWSWDLLGPDEQALLRRLAVFPDSVALDAALVVSGPGADEVGVLGTLDGLVAQSMLVVVEDAATGGLRYRLLETVREFALGALVEADEAAATHAAVDRWALALVAETLPRLSGPHQLDALRRARAEQDNLLHVLHRAEREADLDVLGPVFALLARYWLLRWAFGEITVVGQSVAEAFSGRPVRAEDAGWAVWAFVAAGSPVGFVVDAKRAMRALARLRRLVRRGDVVLPASARAAADLVLVGATGSWDAVGELVDRLRGSDDPTVAMVSTLLASQIAENSGRLGEALLLARRSLDVARALEDPWGQAAAAQSLAGLCAADGDPAGALRWSAVAREAFVGFDAEQVTSQIEMVEASARVAAGHPDDAEPALRAMVAAQDGEAGSGRLEGGRTTPPALEDIGANASDRRTAGQVGLAQVAFLRGRPDEALARMDAALDEVGLRSRRERGQAEVLYASGRLALALLVALDAGPGTGRDTGSTPAARDAWARSVRVRTLAALRVDTRAVDRPLLGAACLALGSYLAGDPGLGRAADGAALVVLAERLGSRQDWVCLVRARHVAALERAVPGFAESLVAARGRQVGAPDPVARVRELLERRPWRAT